MSRKQKTPVAKKEPQSKKLPRSRENPENSDAEKPVWVFSRFDKDGPEQVLPKKDKTKLIEIFDRLKHFESMTWADIKGDSHNVSKDRLIKAAQVKLEILNIIDIDELFSLRLSGTNRIWGILDRHYFKILWWDPEHKICPSNKKHT